MEFEDPTDLMTIRCKKRDAFIARNPDQMSVQIKEFNDNLYFVRYNFL